MNHKQRYFILRTLCQHKLDNFTHVVEVLDDWDNPEGYQVSVDDGKEYSVWVNDNGNYQINKYNDKNY